MPRLYRVILPTPDMERAIAFYREILGQQGESIVPTRYYFACGGVILGVVDPSEHGRPFRPDPDLSYFSVPGLEATGPLSGHLA